MIKAELVSLVAEITTLPKDTVRQSVDTALETITAALGRGEIVILPGFGAFSVVERPAGKRVNPNTGETVEMPARRVPRFQPGKRLLDVVGPPDLTPASSPTPPPATPPQTPPGAAPRRRWGLW